MFLILTSKHLRQVYSNPPELMDFTLGNSFSMQTFSACDLVVFYTGTEFRILKDREGMAGAIFSPRDFGILFSKRVLDSYQIEKVKDEFVLSSQYTGSSAADVF